MKFLTFAMFSILVATLVARAQSTAFTYQGELKQSGSPANGQFDLIFTLHDSLSGGAQVGAASCVDNVRVTNGRFTALVDVGQQFASVSSRYLQVQVRPDTGLDCSNATGFSTLSPRQLIATTPIAAHANSAFALDAPDGSPLSAVSVANDGKVGVGTASPAAPLHVIAPNTGATPGEGVRIQGSLVGATNLAYASFIDGAGTAVGYVGDGSSGNNSVFVGSYLGDVALVPSGGQALTATGAGNVGIGTAAPASKLDVRGDIKLGTSGQYFALKSNSNDRIIRGQVNANGTIDASRSTSGFTITHTVTGTYVINFSPAFSTPPTVVATTMAQCCYAMVSQTQTTFATVFKNNFTTGVGTDSPFQFIAIGQ